MNPRQKETLSYFQDALSTIVEKINSRVKESAASSHFKPAGLSVNNFLLLPFFFDGLSCRFL